MPVLAASPSCCKQVLLAHTKSSYYFRHEETQQRLGSILKVQQEVATVQNKVTELLASGCQFKQHLPAAANKCNLLMKYVEEEMGRLVQKAKDEGATAAHLQTVLDLNSKSRNALEFVVNAVGE